MTTAQVVETSVTVNNNSPIQDYVHPDDQTQPTFEMTPGFKPFTVLSFMLRSEAYVLISAAMRGKSEVSSTYFRILYHSLHKLFTRIANSNEAYFFPCGIPPRGEIV